MSTSWSASAFIPAQMHQELCVRALPKWCTVSWFLLLTIAALSFCRPCINLHNSTDHKLCRTPLLVSCACGVSKFDHIRQHITDCGFTGCQYISVSSSLRCVCCRTNYKAVSRYLVDLCRPAAPQQQSVWHDRHLGGATDWAHCRHDRHRLWSTCICCSSVVSMKRNQLS